MRNWWRNDTLQAYKERTTCLETEYGNLTTETGEHINGVQTLGENIADNGGGKAAYEAYKRLPDAEKQCVPGFNFTSDQLFWVKFLETLLIKLYQISTAWLLILLVHIGPWGQDGS